ncbi:hypothetical protein RF11_00162 [Thelohanellus kitauei]|uniref:Uncharacterized protein n=1 Tax=Thelohanellus kitauei TaxID=669202 RepID=A0A0C2IY56_THEKT|nr:hypothetical protein RF11_00162 [Thelohanellus kitauei]
MVKRSKKYNYLYQKLVCHYSDVGALIHSVFYRNHHTNLPRRFRATVLIKQNQRFYDCQFNGLNSVLLPYKKSLKYKSAKIVNDKIKKGKYMGLKYRGKVFARF